MSPSAIQTLRFSLNMSYREFARALGLSHKNGDVTVRRWESGLRKPSAQTVMLMKLLGETRESGS